MNQLIQKKKKTLSSKTKENLKKLITNKFDLRYFNYALKVKPHVDTPLAVERLPYARVLQPCDDLKTFIQTLSVGLKDSNLAIDGTCGSGKSSILSKLGCPVLKISQYIDDDKRNFDPIQSLTYLLASCRMIETSKNCVFDRSPISNVAWLIIPQVYAIYEDNSKLTHYGLVESVINNSRLESLLKYIKAKNFNVLMMIDTNVDYVCHKLKVRNASATDAFVSNWSMYIICQNIVYSYLAQMLGYVCWDMEYLRTFAFDKGLLESELYDEIANVLKQENEDPKLPLIVPQNNFDVQGDHIIKRKLIHKR